MPQTETPTQDSIGRSVRGVEGAILVAVAAPREALAVARGLGGATSEDFPPWTAAEVARGWWVVRTGVGKANAAGAVAWTLADRAFGGVINAGVAGALPNGTDTLDLGESLVATRCVMADEGIETPGGYVSCAEIGFPVCNEADTLDASALDPGRDLVGRLQRVVSRAGPIATVSTCSGTDALAAEVARRTGAIAEAMEGAAAGLACARAGVPFAELRVVSNTTGDRDTQRWDLDLAFERLAHVFGRLA